MRVLTTAKKTVRTFGNIQALEDIQNVGLFYLFMRGTWKCCLFFGHSFLPRGHHSSLSRLCSSVVWISPVK